MRIFTYNQKLVEETSYATGKVVFFKYIKEEEKERCPHCDKPIEIEMSIVEDCLNWKEQVKAVKTL